MDAMLSVGSVSCGDMKRLRSLFDQVSSNLRSLRSLGVGSEAYGSLLCRVLIRKLPPELQLTLSRKVSEDNWKLDELLRVIEEDIVTRERVTVMQASKPKRENKPPPSAATLVSDTKSTSNEGCCYCGRNHLPTKCDIAKEADARKQVLHRNGRCFVCLKRGHLGRNCRSSYRCHTCSGCHHDSICAPQQIKTTNNSPEASGMQAPPLPVETTSGLNPTAPEFSPSTGGTFLYLNANKTVILQTAIAEVYNPDEYT